jgi:multidrug efflux system outer membrane protein
VRQALALAFAAAALAGCTLETTYVRPVPATPATWPVGAAYPAAVPGAVQAPSYRDVFRDPHLQTLIAGALASNQDLAAALANVEIARSQYRVTRSGLLPKLGAEFGGSEAQTNPRLLNPDGTTTRRRQIVRAYEGDIRLSAFEVDLFGRVRSLTKAAREQYLASESGARAARLTLVAAIANAYLTLAADRSLLAIAIDTEASAAKSVELTQARLSGGVAPRSDLLQAQTILQQARSDHAGLVTLVAQDRNALELLLGGPAADGDLPGSLESVDGLLAQVPAGLDSRVLLARPDVAEAEARLRAANAQIGAARAAFFPTISLTGLAGVASPALRSLFGPGNFTWQAQGAALQPIFAGGANLGNLARANAERDLALARYQKAIQSAFRDVADALARAGTIDDQLAAQAELEAAASDSYALADARYRQGVAPFLNTLDAQRTLYSARRTLAAARLLKARNRVSLYASLGDDPLLAKP